MKKKRNPLAKDLKTPKYRIRVKPDKTKCTNKCDPNKGMHQFNADDMKKYFPSDIVECFFSVVSKKRNN